jgi:autotransporter-associated beta strand protein
MICGLAGSGTATVKDSGVLTIDGGAGTIWLANGASAVGTLNIGSGGTAGTIQAATVSGASGTATVNFNHNEAAYTFSPVLAGGLAVNHTGSGTTTLSGSNTYTGKTTISQGILKISAESKLGGNPGSSTADQLKLNGGTLQTTATFSIDDSNRGVTLGASGGTFSPDNGTTLTIANAITGTGGLTKSGAGALTLSGANDYSGTTTISAGTLQIGSGGTSGTLGTGGITTDNSKNNGYLT